MKTCKLVIAVLAVSVFSVSALATEHTCATATSVACNGSITLDPCDDSKPEGPLGECTTGGGVLDVWAKFIATETTVRIHTIDSVGTDSDYVVYSGTCGDLTAIGCSEDDVPPFNGDIEVCGLTVGETYTIRLGSWDDSCSGGYTLTVECPNASGAFCGDGAVNCQPEECDGADDSACPGICEGDCQCARVCGDGQAIGDEECDGDDNSACEVSCEGDCTCTPPVCGNGIRFGDEECDGAEISGCLAGASCLEDCTCSEVPVPMLPKWGLMGLALLLVVGGAAVFGRRRTAHNA